VNCCRCPVAARSCTLYTGVRRGGNENCEEEEDDDLGFSNAS